MDRVNNFVERDGLVVVQLGAGDGTTDDTVSQYIKKHKWRGVLVEPVDWLYDMLKDKYAENSNIVTLNAAVSDMGPWSANSIPEFVCWQTETFDQQSRHHIAMIPFSEEDDPVNFIIAGKEGIDKYSALSNIKVVPTRDINFMDLQSLFDVAKEKFEKIDIVYTELVVHESMSPMHFNIFLDTGLANDVKMISYDKIPSGNSGKFPRTFKDAVSHPGWHSMGIGLGELDYGDPGFGESSPMDYGFNEPDKSMSELGHVPGLPRLDRNLLLNKKYYTDIKI